MTSSRRALAVAAVVACACAPPPRDPSLGRDDGGAGRTADAAGHAGSAAGTVGSSRAGSGGGAGAAGMPAFAGQGGGAAVPGVGTAGMGAPFPPDVIRPGPGCGKPLPPDQARTVPDTPIGYKRYMVFAQGQTLAGPMPMKAGPRSFWVRVPVDYDPARPYPVVYLGQGCGGTNQANTATYPLYKETLGGTEQAIYVALDIPTDMANMDCYDTLDGNASQELEAFEMINDAVVNTYCVDENRVFAAGYSTGGALASLWVATSRATG